ncbi:hypothetical protein EHS25_002133 [Saitozyma podzolica]|uniref:Protein phosphatase n=1 Tax=Saitozyma podzolica TaxID=1890683 RepID=A0A427YER6_9TREE|nr:hypothetical protein EHS25_002133 [Saitozyma podzolica]
MSKPKPGLGKGLVRLAHHSAHHPHPHAHVHTHSSSASVPFALNLAPVVSGPSGSRASGSAGTVAGAGAGRQTSSATGQVPNKAATHSASTFAHSSIPHYTSSSPSSTTASVSQHGAGAALQSQGTGSSPSQASTQPGYLALLPSWDPISIPAVSEAMTRLSLPDVTSIVTHYRPASSAAYTASSSSAVAAGPSRLPIRLSVPAPTPVRMRRYTTATAPARDAFGFTSHASYAPGTGPASAPGGPSLPPSLLFEVPAPFWPFAFTGPGKGMQATPLTHEFFSSPPPPPPEGGSRGSPPPIKQPRPSESHTVLSPANMPSSDSGSASMPLISHPYLAFPDLPDPSVIPTPPTSADGTLSNEYTSNLVFRFGASGLPKERPPPTPPPPGRQRAAPPPPRPRSFPLPNVTAPAELASVGVGEDAYFTRADGMCVADGVGGWARSGRGGADAGRWSRLLTHFCEGEVAAWWAGAEGYVEPAPSQGKGRGKAQGKGEGESALGPEDGVSGWTRRLWPRAQAGTIGAEARDDDAHGLPDGVRRRKLDPVEIMQRGFEKCLACVLQEGIHGSSTCLLALLHHSSLLIANIGDCCLLVIRNGQVVFRTSEMQHAFNFPLQLGTHSRDEPMKDAQRFTVEVEKEDVVVVGSDGLMDNLFDEDILDTLAEFAPPTSTMPPTPPSSRPASTSGQPPFDPEKVSEALCRKAREVSEQTSATTPFMVRAIEEGIDFVGGKKDDISVLVGVIGERRSEEGKQSLALNTQ